MKHFVTLFPPAENVHLIKDVGQIPYGMHRYFGHKSTLVCYNNSEAYSYLHNEVEGLNLTFIENRGSPFFWEKSVLHYLRKHARSIDVLNLYHLTQSSLLYGIIYKLFNPGGVLYLKLDFNLHRYKKKGFRFSDNAAKEKIHHFLLNLFLRKADIISVETREAEELLKKEDNRFVNSLIYLPNGVDNAIISCEEEKISVRPKENLILTVGRIGLPEKNHDVFLQALSQADLKGWSVSFVGPIQPSFQPQIETFYRKNPALKDKVEFTGPIVDRDKLFDFYKRAKIFCLPSRSEGFPMALIEALSCGNYLVGTDRITSIREVTDDGKHGHIVSANDAEALRGTLEEVTRDGFYDDSMKQNIMEYARRFRWKPILSELEQRIIKVEAGK